MTDFLARTRIHTKMTSNTPPGGAAAAPISVEEKQRRVRLALRKYWRTIAPQLRPNVSLKKFEECALAHVVWIHEAYPHWGPPDQPELHLIDCAHTILRVAYPPRNVGHPIQLRRGRTPKANDLVEFFVRRRVHNLRPSSRMPHLNCQQATLVLSNRILANAAGVL